MRRGIACAYDTFAVRAFRILTPSHYRRLPWKNGLGSIKGVLLAGLLLGMTQVISARVDPNAGLLYVHLVFFAALVWRALRGGLR